MLALLERRSLGVLRNSHITQKPFSPTYVNQAHEAFSQELRGLTKNTKELELRIAGSSTMQYNGQNCITALQLLSKSTNKEALDSVLKACRKMAFTPKEMSHVCYGMALNKEMFPRIPDFMVNQLVATQEWNDFTLPNLIVLLRAFSMARQRNPVLLEKVYHTCMDKERDFMDCEVDDMVMLLLPFALFRFPCKVLGDKVANRILHDPLVLERASFRDMAMLLDTLQKLDCLNCHLLALVSTRIVTQQQLEIKSGRDVAKMVKAFAKSQHKELIQALAVQVCSLDFKQEFSVPLLASFAQATHASAELVQWFSNGILSVSLEQCKIADLALMLSSMKHLGGAQTAVDKLAEEIDRRDLSKFTDLDLDVFIQLLPTSNTKLLEEQKRRISQIANVLI